MTEIETAKMSERGQIIIPKEVRDYIEADENTVFTVMPLDKETIVMKKLDTAQLMKEFRNLRQRAIKITNDEINKEIRETRNAKR